MLLGFASSARLGVEVFYELARASFFPQSSIRSVIKADAVDLSGCSLTPSERAFVRQLARVLWRLGKIVPFRARCIHRSVAAFRILTRRGIPCRLVITPMDRSDFRFTAHAWVESAENLAIGGALNSTHRFTLRSEVSLVGPT
jgi:hypothetical protein